jgi:hypothetical protein
MSGSADAYNSVLHIHGLGKSALVIPIRMMENSIAVHARVVNLMKPGCQRYLSKPNRKYRIIE